VATVVMLPSVDLEGPLLLVSEDSLLLGSAVHLVASQGVINQVVMLPSVDLEGPPLLVLEDSLLLGSAEHQVAITLCL